ncbi:MAG: Mut7-C RNAse domain-containing protein [Planctomycetota bacterium]|jgi:uncharacterized protein with PIN domain
MGVICPGCGRAYHKDLFRYGRSLHCACGSVVAADTLLRDEAFQRPPCFMADAMLGRLARWLRILGFDTAYEAHIDDGDLVRRAVRQRRIILTRDRLLAAQWRVSGIHVIETETPMAQLREIEAAHALCRDARPFTRCSRCNTGLHAADRNDVRGEIPPRVLLDHERFLRCPRCRRVYWSGSHVDRIRRAMSRALPALPTAHHPL